MIEAGRAVSLGELSVFRLANNITMPPANYSATMRAIQRQRRDITVTTRANRFAGT